MHVQSLPIAIIPTCIQEFDSRDFHSVPQVYSEFSLLTGCLPLIVTTESDRELAILLDLTDGISLPGNSNNLYPSHFNEAISQTFGDASRAFRYQRRSFA